jgi:hypothetical protein
MVLVCMCVCVCVWNEWRGTGSRGVSLNLGPLPNFIIWIYSQYFHPHRSHFYHPRFQLHRVFHYNATCSFTQYGAWVGCVPFHTNSQRNNQNIPHNFLYDVNSQAYFLIFFRALLRTSCFSVKLNEMETTPTVAVLIKLCNKYFNGHDFNKYFITFTVHLSRPTNKQICFRAQIFVHI